MEKVKICRLILDQKKRPYSVNTVYKDLLLSLVDMCKLLYDL